MTFLPGDEEEPFSRSDAPQAFWEYVRRHGRNGGFDNENIRALEQRVEQRFGRYLRDVLITAFRSGTEYQYRRRPPFPVEFYVERGGATTAPAFAFQVAGFRYGSLTLDIDVAGLKGLSEFFDKNVELFQVVLCQYAPTALAMAVSGNGGGGIDGLGCKLKFPPELATAFNDATAAGNPSHTLTAAPASTPKKLESLNWAWIVSNTSLVLPVLLALLVIYFAFVGLDRERDRLSQGLTSLADKQTEVLKLLATTVQQKTAATEAQKSNSATK
ncbi:MAG TPA: hypothetical protein VN736_15185 [Candidatus Limnocylindrales bacterium]|jgi:hypothetical protein|nr:hypothetical protein [Candidatus Limnocylindrales bacterium]